MILLLGTFAFAGEPRVEEVVLDWASVGFVAAVPERPAMGADMIAAGPGDRVVMIDTVNDRVLVVDGLKLTGSFPAKADDLAVTAAGDVVVLDGRTLRLFTATGAEKSSIAMPDLVPTGVTLQILDDRLYGVDPFGNLRSAGRVDGGALVASFGASILPPAHRIVAEGGSITVDDKPLPLPVALKAGARGVGDWIVVDLVVAEQPLTVERIALSPAGDKVPLPTERLYAPTRDVAADGAGRLLVIVPLADGLHLRRVTP